MPELASQPFYAALHVPSSHKQPAMLLLRKVSLRLVPGVSVTQTQLNDANLRAPSTALATQHDMRTHAGTKK